VFWHSSAHVLGSCLENLFGAHLCIGPATNTGFFYDAYYGDYTLTPESLAKIELEMKRIIKSKYPFQRAVIDKTQALELFDYNPFKA
jgi:threonyl-tRNA synthetase